VPAGLPTRQRNGSADDRKCDRYSDHECTPPRALPRLGFRLGGDAADVLAKLGGSHRQ
jgi:hypothetical protein